ncbi:MAG: tRNA lysidine(34) synthetase TilS [Candidatus Gastranaerophilaceae bacterium]|jgi:tRNA(Ile)-lysidine synthase
MNNIVKKIKDFLNQHNLLLSSKTYLTGFSGGYDSLCLLDVLKDLSKEYGFKLVAAHLNHNWRAEESLKEELNAKKYCENNAIEFYSETLSSVFQQTETIARNQRYIFFKQTALKYNATAIFTGHTKTDNVETIIYRIIKGTGLKGLQGIPEKRFLENIPIYRTMLDISREDTIKYCQCKNLEPNIDSSNENIHYQRNKIRLNLIPQLKEYNSNVEKSILKLSQIAQEREELAQEYISQIKNSILNNKAEIISKKFINLKTCFKSGIVKNILECEKIEYDYEKIHNIINFIESSAVLKSGNTLSLTTDKWLFVSSKVIKIFNANYLNVIKSTVRINFEGRTYYEPLDKTLIITKWEGEKPDKFPESTDLTLFADFSNLKEPFYIRTRMEGDRITPLGMKEKVKLKKYFINKGIPEHERDKILLLTTDTEILWATEIGISEKLRVKNIPTHRIELKKGQ